MYHYCFHEVLEYFICLRQMKDISSYINFSLEHFFAVYLFILFIFGCVGSSLLHVGFSLVAVSRGFSCCGARALGVRASVVVVRGLSSCGSQAPEHRLSSCGTRA